MNAVYHRSYEEREPIEVRISREELVVLSFPGPDRSIRLADFEAGRAVSRRYRNRRIGEFLKELDLTEGRSTGIPKILKVMAANGSPAPLFETDDERASFVVRLPVHPLAKQPTTDVTTDVATDVATDDNASSASCLGLQPNGRPIKLFRHDGVFHFQWPMKLSSVRLETI
ncbi:ATP-binding protein [Noviherbaspirillum sedimenti]|uniref:ATP-binding protein n=1 Tax=Noviherbaspirillum sedimenti TaxID=2320865 RepID=UPI0018F5BC97|nr:ATP-binding protein [Noviherbaspirillum sedimenti]